MPDDTITAYAIDRGKVRCRMCNEPARCHVTLWTADEGEKGRVDCDACGLVEWRPIRRAVDTNRQKRV